MPPLVQNETCHLKLSRLSSFAACARNEESQNDALILHRLKTIEKLTIIKFNNEHVLTFFSLSAIPTYIQVK